jgi:hypothetical protein
MEDLLMRFPHLGETIFECLVNETVVMCKSVGRTLNVFLDNEKIFWIRCLQTTIVDYSFGLSVNPMHQKEYCVEKQLKGLSASAIKIMAQEAAKYSLFNNRFVRWYQKLLLNESKNYFNEILLISLEVELSIVIKIHVHTKSVVIVTLNLATKYTAYHFKIRDSLLRFLIP